MKKLKSIALSAWTLMSTGGIALAQGTGSGTSLEDIDLELISPDTELITILGNAVTWIMGIAGAIAVIYLIYGGIIYITGGEKGAEGGKKIIVNAIIGLAIIALSAVIASTVMGILSA